MAQVSLRNAKPPLIVTVDIGTTSVRALLFDRQGHCVEGAEGRGTCPSRITGGNVEANADELVDLVTRALDEALYHAGPLASQIAGVAVCTFWHSLLGVGKNDEALTPVYTWTDTRAAAEAEELRRKLDENAVHARTGCMLRSCYVPAKLRWIFRRDPALYRRCTRWVSIGEYLFLRYFGRSLATVSMASGTGLLNVHACDWDAEVLNVLQLPMDQLSPLGDVNAVLTGLREPMARKWPFLKKVPWIPPVGDGACNSLGCGATSRGRFALTIGGATALRVLWKAEKTDIPPGLFGHRADRQRYVLGGALADGTNFIDWIRRLFHTGLPDEMERELAGMEADAHGLTFLPFPSGERNPGWAANARAALTGLTIETKPSEILRAGLESVAYRFAILHDLLLSAVPEAREIVASGGALLRSPLWMQILADVIGRPVTACGEPDPTSRGAALLALEVLKAFPDLEAAPASFGRTFMPHPARHERYHEALERHRRLYSFLVVRKV